MEIMDVVRLVREVRREQRITAKELSRKIGISSKQLSLIETGQAKNVRLITLLKLVTGLGLKIQIIKEEVTV